MDKMIKDQKVSEFNDLKTKVYLETTVNEHLIISSETSFNGNKISESKILLSRRQIQQLKELLNDLGL